MVKIIKRTGIGLLVIGIVLGVICGGVYLVHLVIDYPKIAGICAAIVGVLLLAYRLGKFIDIESKKP